MIRKLEVNYWLPEYRDNANRIEKSPWTVTDLLTLTIGRPGGLKDGPGGWLISKSEYVEHGVPVIRATNVSENGLDLTDAVFISPEKNAELSATQISPGDLLLTMRGTIGRSCVVPNDVVTANMNAAICRIRLREPDNGAFLRDFLNCAVGRLQALRQGHKAVQGDLNLDAIGAFRVPVPDKQQRDAFVASMDAARAERRAKLAEADALLAGLDDYLLATLGLTPPRKDERKVFAVSVSALGSQVRLNADYFHPERILALRAFEHTTQELDCPRLEQVVDFIRDQIKAPDSNYLSLANVQSNTGELVPTDEEVTGTCSVFQRGDVLFARLRPYLNKVHAAESDGSCSPEFHVLRVKDSEALHPDYLAAVLRSSLTLAQTRHMMTGNTHPRLTNEDVVNLVIPVPKPAVQEIIASEARRRREEARRLRADADAGWQAAKRWFEEQLLDPRQS